MRRMRMLVAIPNGEKPRRPDNEPGLFADLLLYALRRTEPYISPAARQRPAAILALANQQQFSIAENRSTYVDFGRRIAPFKCKQSGGNSDLFRFRTGQHRCAQTAEFFVTLAIVGLLSIRKARLTYGMQPLREVDPGEV